MNILEKNINDNLPNFLIVGAQKSGTTTLYDILNSHPEVNMSKTKEINFTSKKILKKVCHIILHILISQKKIKKLQEKQLQDI